MRWRDLIDASLVDVRPSTLPDRAPRCLDDELLPRVQPLPERPPSAYGLHSRAHWRRRRERAAEAARKEAQQVHAQPGPTDDELALRLWCSECTVRVALGDDGTCGRRRCRRTA